MTDFCTIISSQNAFIDHIFSDVHTQYRNHEWLAEKVILAAKYVDFNYLNYKIQQLLLGDLVLYKSIGTVYDAIQRNCKLFNGVFELIGLV